MMAHNDSLASLRLGDTNAFFTFDEEPSKEITCAICFEPWQHAVELRPCGHIFCESCLPPVTNDNMEEGAPLGRCPLCRTATLAQIPPNRALSNLVSSLPTSCTRCAWKGEYSQYQLHDCPAGNEHRLPPRQSTNPHAAVNVANAVDDEEHGHLQYGLSLLLGRTPARTTTTTRYGTTEAADDIGSELFHPLFNGRRMRRNTTSSSTQNNNDPDAENEERRTTAKRLFICLVVLAMIIPIALYVRNFDRHDGKHNADDDDSLNQKDQSGGATTTTSPSDPPPPFTAAPSPTNKPHRSTYQCSEAVCAASRCLSSSTKEGNIGGVSSNPFTCAKWELQENSVDQNMKNGTTCSRTAHIDNCAEVCNLLTCEPTWRACPKDVCRRRHERSEQCPDGVKPFWCYHGLLNGTCSDQPDIGYCDALCDVRTCSV